MDDNKGAFTIEAVIVMNTIIIILFSVMYAFMLLYQNVVLVYAASYSAQQGAEIWVDSRKNLENGDWNPEQPKDGLYYRITNDYPGSALAQKKVDKIKSAVSSKLSKGILSPKSTTVKIKFENYIIQRTITVDIEQNIPFPFLGIARYFGVTGDGLVLKAKAKSAVAEPAEYIRNIDLAFEYAKRVETAMSEVISFEKFKSLISK